MLSLTKRCMWWWPKQHNAANLVDEQRQKRSEKNPPNAPLYWPHSQKLLFWIVS